MRKLLYFFLACFLFVACEEEYEAGKTNTETVAGEWFVKKLTMDGVVVKDYKHISTYNTNENSATKIWLDVDPIFGAKLKVDCDTEKLTFGVTEYEAEGSEFDIINGKILEGVATTSGGNVSDSIYFEITEKYLDDKGIPAEENYIVAGYRRTGFLEDEH